MSNGTYATVTTQAWSTYTSVSGRTTIYIDLLTPSYTDFLNGIKIMDGLTASLNSPTPPTKDVESALAQITILEGAFTNIDAVVEKFKSMDASAVNKAATLDQAKVRKQLDEAEGYDQDLLNDLNNVLYQCQLMTADAALNSGT